VVTDIAEEPGQSVVVNTKRKRNAVCEYFRHHRKRQRFLDMIHEADGLHYGRLKLGKTLFSIKH